MKLFKYYKIIIIPLLFSTLFFATKAQEITTNENVISEIELQNHNILCITQDTQGFLWIGTSSGLYKYDGYSFKEYLVKTNPSIINNNVIALLVDGDNLWIGTKGGITILNTKTNKTESISDKLTNIYVTNLYRDKSNNIWVGYNSNDVSKHLGDYKFQHFDLNIRKENDFFSVRGIVEPIPNTFYYKMVCEISNFITILEVKHNLNSITTNVIAEDIKDSNVLLFSKDSALFVIRDDTIFSYSAENQKYKYVKKIFDKDTIQNLNIFIDNDSKIYLGTKKSSFYNLNKETLLPENYSLINRDASWVNNFFLDNSGLLWVGTSNGLYKVKKRKKLFKKYLSNSNSKPPNKIRSIIQDSIGDIYAVNELDLFKFDSISDNFQNVNVKNKNVFDSPNTLLENDTNTLLVGTQNSGIHIYDKNTNIFKSFLKENKKLETNQVIKLCRDKQNILWVGTLDGLHYFDYKKDTLVKIIDFGKQNFSEIEEAVYNIKPFKENQIWVGTGTGLYHLKVDYSVFPLKIDVEKVKNIPNTVRSILIDDDILWIATQTEGVIKYNSKTLETVFINESNGLASNSVFSILKGENSEIWIGTLKGISRYNITTKQFLNYYDYDGLADNKFTANSQLRTKKGELFFGGQNGISSFNPIDFKSDSTNVNLNITSISWFGSNRDSKTILDVDNSNIQPLELPFTNSFINFEFSLTDYFKPQNNTFKYRILGLHNDWRMLKESNVLSFTNFPPGQYNLEVMASTNYGKWNNQMINLPIIVAEVYYKEWWFLTLWGALTLLIFYSMRKYELRHMKNIEELRLRISRDLHDELGGALTGIAIRSELVSEEIDKGKKKEYLEEISLQSRAAVDSLSDIVWALDSTNNSIQDLYDRMESIMFKLLTPLKINYSFNPLKGKKYISLKHKNRHHLFLIFKEAINNIAKHSNATHVNVKMVKEKNKINLTIKDNGTKISTFKDNLNGHGIENMKLRAKKINGKILINTEDGFTLEIWFDFSVRKNYINM